MSRRVLNSQKLIPTTAHFSPKNRILRKYNNILEHQQRKQNIPKCTCSPSCASPFAVEIYIPCTIGGTTHMQRAHNTMYNWQYKSIRCMCVLLFRPTQLL